MSHDERAAQAVIEHHRELAGALAGQVTALLEAASTGAPQVWQHRDALLSWLRTELLPHASAEEAAMYPAAAARPAGRLLIDGMLDEHRVITALVTELAEAAEPVAAAAAARALQAVFTTHLVKENDLVVPLLVAAEEVSLAGLLDGLHDLIGGSPTSGCSTHACGCGDAAQPLTIESRQPV
jgi:iron-sulfur cluster repair protein YtfE (RIC family)